MEDDPSPVEQPGNVFEGGLLLALHIVPGIMNVTTYPGNYHLPPTPGIMTV